MNRTAALGTVFLSIVVFSLAGWTQPEPFIGIVESVEARVGDEVITTSEVDERLQQVEMGGLARPFRDQMEYERYRQRELDKLIQESLLVQEARRRGYQMDEKQMEAGVEQRWQRQVEMHGGEESMREYLAESGLSEGTLRKVIADDVERSYLQERLLRAEVTLDIRVTPEEIERFKRENPGMLDELERIELSHILIAVPENASADEEAEARRKAEGLVTEIRARGMDAFEAFAQEYSDHAATRSKGGNLGLVRRGELSEEFDVAFDLLPGEVSDPVRTRQGFHILKVTGKWTIAERLHQQKLKSAAQEFLNRLFDESIVVVKGRAPQ